MAELMSGILYGEIANRPTFAQNHLNSVLFTLEGSLYHIFMDLVGLLSS